MPGCGLRGVTLIVGLCLPTAATMAQTPETDRLAERLQPFLRVLSESSKPFQVSGEVQLPIDGRVQKVALRLARFDSESFELDLKHADYSLSIRRQTGATAFALPHHRVVFVGTGTVGDSDHLAPRDILNRLVSPASLVSRYVPLVTQTNARAVAILLTSLLSLEYNETAEVWQIGDKVRLRFEADRDASGGHVCELRVDDVRVRMRLDKPAAAATVSSWPGFRSVVLERSELERQLLRGVRRASEILAPGPELTEPRQVAKTVPHGELRWVHGQRVILLQGTPEQIGHAHGALLREQAMRCIDSVLYTFGTAQTIRSGRWFRHELDSAYARLAPHIPDDHKRETRALAGSLGLDVALTESLNVFPELFHCSGFAVFGKATRDGKLYHGRVLDYMTTIGLQDAATTFIVHVHDKIPFANVGYAGFIGSVSGMNARKISVGEMGGRGEGQWDGVPMATLMRRALEECSTLDEVMHLWKSNPRTCEYYYVFADGNSRRAVGVAALPESLEFIFPGQSHPRLGDGIEDSVVLSAGSRLEKLRERVTQRHGQIDADSALWLMSRPVAMQSNLHNVLFVPEDGVFYVANADHKRPAAERPYVRHNLLELLNSMQAEQRSASPSASER
ncbi:MAG: C45 family peptidase [Planctomycetaceae bacterium]